MQNRLQYIVSKLSNYYHNQKAKIIVKQKGERTVVYGKTSNFFFIILWLFLLLQFVGLLFIDWRLSIVLLLVTPPIFVFNLNFQVILTPTKVKLIKKFLFIPYSSLSIPITEIFLLGNRFTANSGILKRYGIKQLCTQIEVDDYYDEAGEFDIGWTLTFMNKGIFADFRIGTKKNITVLEKQIISHIKKYEN